MPLFIIARYGALGRLKKRTLAIASDTDAGEEIRTSSVAAPLPLAHDLVVATGCCCRDAVSVFFVTVARGSSMGSRFLFFGAGGMMAAEDVLADRA